MPQGGQRAANGAKDAASSKKPFIRFDQSGGGTPALTAGAPIMKKGNLTVGGGASYNPQSQQPSFGVGVEHRW